jgi:hypothetical protein
MKIRFHKDYAISRDDTIIHYDEIRKLCDMLGFGNFKMDILPVAEINNFRLKAFLVGLRYIRLGLPYFLNYQIILTKADANKINSTNIEDKTSFGIEMDRFPIQNLFLWSLLLNRIELAKIFWQIGNVSLPVRLSGGPC